MANTLEFTAKNVKPFSAWLKKFSSIEKSLLVEIDAEKKCFIAKSYNKDKSIVKYASISFADAGLTPKKEADVVSVKVGIYDISRVIKSIDHFQTGDFTLTIQYAEILDENAKNLVSTAFLLRSTSLKMKIETSSVKIFKKITPEVFERIVATNVATKFDLPDVTIEKIEALCELDKEYKFLEFEVKNKKVFVRGQTFELDVADDGDEKAILSIYKDQFDRVDVESYTVDLGDDKLVFRSNDTDTVTVLSMVVKDDKYEESSPEF
jgi:hypothetical protein